MTILRGVGPLIRMRGRLGVMIGFDLDDDAANAVDQQRRADQIGRHLMDAAAEERTLQRSAEFCGRFAAAAELRF